MTMRRSEGPKDRQIRWWRGKCFPAENPESFFIFHSIIITIIIHLLLNIENMMIVMQTLRIFGVVTQKMIIFLDRERKERSHSSSHQNVKQEGRTSFRELFMPEWSLQPHFYLLSCPGKDRRRENRWWRRGFFRWTKRSSGERGVIHSLHIDFLLQTFLRYLTFTPQVLYLLPDNPLLNHFALLQTCTPWELKTSRV